MKYQKRIQWDRYRPELLKVGFIFALAVTLMAFNYTTNLPVYDALSVAPEIEETMIIPPPTVHKKKVPLPSPPPPPKLISTTEIEPVTEDVIEFEPEVDIEEDLTPIIDEYSNTSAPAPIVEPPAETLEEETPIIIAERMPVYGSCDLEDEENQRRDCTSQNIMKHIYKNVKYPDRARNYETQGTVVVSFVVNKEGNVEDIKIIKDIGMGCGEEVKRVVQQLDKFLPGKQNGRPVSVIYRIPVKFHLQ